jgi:hypothetical protein
MRDVLDPVQTHRFTGQAASGTSRGAAARSMRATTRTHKHTHTHTHTQTNKHTHSLTHTHTHTASGIRTHTHERTHARTHARTQAHILCACVRACVRVRASACVEQHLVRRAARLLAEEHAPPVVRLRRRPARAVSPPRVTEARWVRSCVVLRSALVETGAALCCCNGVWNGFAIVLFLCRAVSRTMVWCGGRCDGIRADAGEEGVWEGLTVV